MHSLFGAADRRHACDGREREWVRERMFFEWAKRRRRRRWRRRRRTRLVRVGRGRAGEWPAGRRVTGNGVSRRRRRVPPRACCRPRARDESVVGLGPRPPRSSGRRTAGSRHWPTGNSRPRPPPTALRRVIRAAVSRARADDQTLPSVGTLFRTDVPWPTDSAPTTHNRPLRGTRLGLRSVYV